MKSVLSSDRFPPEILALTGLFDDLIMEIALVFYFDALAVQEMHVFLSSVVLAIFVGPSEPFSTDKGKEEEEDVLKDVVPIKDNVHCLVVADLYNFGRNETRYAQEKRLIKFIASRFFERTDVSTMGVATYGYVSELPINLNKALNRMAVSYDEFARNLEPNTQLGANNNHSNTAELV
ncbi:hypothetical protein Y032_0032g2503 [Ancylostoma ceylanicum]|uniref:Uncharacterized protein n=2 Tax=Ancylostoma ceylanicum TaxID=53326 RepID=A0A016UNN5_9BILA|nr:hypothetical protein Y032_0032g2503 [Ancylostoma ceylanicum]